MARCQYLVHCFKDLDATAKEEGSRDCSSTVDGENGRYFATRAEKVPRLEEAGSVKREVPSKEAAT